MHLPMRIDDVATPEYTDNWAKLLLGVMRPGQSVLLPTDRANTLCSTAYSWGLRVSKRKAEKGTYRVWRV